MDGGLDGIDLIASELVVTPDLVAWMHGHGKIVAVWVWRAPAQNDNPHMWAAMANIGVDVFTTNVPHALEQWLAEATDVAFTSAMIEGPARLTREQRGLSKRMRAPLGRG